MNKMAETGELESFKNDAGIYDNVASESATPVKEQTSIQGAEEKRQASTEHECACQCDTVVLRRMLFVVAAVAAVALLTAIATLILALTAMKPRDDSTGKVQDRDITGVMKSKDYNIIEKISENVTTSVKKMVNNEMETVWLNANKSMKCCNNLTSSFHSFLKNNPCSSYPCFHNGTCWNGFTDHKYLCECQAGYTGEQCGTVVARSCKELYDKNISQGNKAYLLQVDSKKVHVYCHMTSSGLGACGSGGWTLVMKIDGSKRTFHYHSKLWSNKIDFNLAGGKTGFDSYETKLPTYWNTPFSKICLGMKIHGEETTSFIDINKSADSLYSLIADGQFRATSLGRNTWKTLLGSQGSLQSNCNNEGFNATGDSYSYSKARIGILGNNENYCTTCDSRIGFGTGGYPDETNTCGNVAKHGGDNGDKNIKTMGYILVQ